MSALDNLDVLEYRVTQLEKLLEPLMKLVNDLEKKLALLAQKMLIATMLIGGVINGIGVWYSANAGKDDSKNTATVSVSAPAKSDGDRIKLLESELARLKSNKILQVH